MGRRRVLKHVVTNSPVCEIPQKHRLCSLNIRKGIDASQLARSFPMFIDALSLTGMIVVPLMLGVVLAAQRYQAVEQDG